ncbi:helix-turn-helix domain-containing protein [Streptomyces sp. NPDC093269]|uniref:helix-turn-helix domain-containing protein n=1 Tax=Streptomyces sp. NPDC093269 TaxID=3366038 RepID=UPI003808EB2B
MTAPVQVGPSTNGGPAPFDLEDYLADIGDRIRAERQARGWTLPELANLAGIGLATLKRIESGNLSMRPFLQACWALEVPPDHVMSDRWSLPGAVRELHLSPRQVRVLREAASGDSLSQVAARLGEDSRAVGACLSQVYGRLGVAEVPQAERRAAAVRVAMQHNLFTPANQTT